jgi:hypothetical protein
MTESTGDAEVDSPSQDIDAPKPPATPRWVKITGVVLALIVVAVVVKLAFGGGVGGHGPGMHGGMGSTSSWPDGTGDVSVQALRGP